MRILWKMGRKDWGAREARNTTKKPTKSTNWVNRGPRRLNNQPKSLHGTNLGLLYTLLLCSLVFLQDSLQWEQELSLTLLPDF